MRVIGWILLLIGSVGCSSIEKRPAGGLELRPQLAQTSVVGAAETEAVFAGERQIKKTAFLSVEVDHLASAATKVDGLIKTNEGQIESKTISRSDTAQFYSRVPPARLTQVLDQIAVLGRELERTLSSDDLTQEISDVSIQVRTQRALHSRLTQLLSRAKDVKEILELERELARIQAEIEQLESRLKRAKSDVAMATLNIQLKEKLRLGPLGWVGYQLGRGLKWLFVRE